MSKNTANNETNSPKKPRAPRKAKTIEPPAEPKAPSASHAAATLSKYAALGCMVIVTLPPAWKFNVPDRKPYYQIEVQDTQGNSYSDIYRITNKERAKSLSEKIAKDRGIPLKVYEYVNDPAPEPTEPTQQMRDGPQEDTSPDLPEEGDLEPTPF